MSRWFWAVCASSWCAPSPSPSSSRVREVRGVRDVLGVSESVVVGVVDSGLMSVVIGGLVLVIVSVVVGVDDAGAELLVNVGST